MPSNLAIQAMGDWRRRLLDGLLTGGQDASLEGWPTSLRILIGLVCSLAVPLAGGTHCQCQR
eukprot:1156712-Pelagomonas_calceolata.AAC.1